MTKKEQGPDVTSLSGPPTKGDKDKQERCGEKRSTKAADGQQKCSCSSRPGNIKSKAVAFAGEFRPNQSGARKFYTDQSGAWKFYTDQSRTRKFYADQSGARKLYTDQSGATKLYTDQSGAWKFCAV